MSLVPPDVSQRLQLLRDEAHVLVSRLDRGSLDRDEFGTVYNLIWSDLCSLEDNIDSPDDCPDWCNDHITNLGLDPEDDVSAHSLHVEGDGWFFDIQATDDDGLAFIPADASELTVGQARAYAAAVLSACDAVESAVRTR